MIIVSDVDEIISAGKLIEAIETRRKHDLTIFEMPIHPYYVNRRIAGETWVLGPRMIEFGKFPGAQKLRMCKLYASKKMRGTTLNRLHTRLWNAVHCGVGARICRIENSGWHLTSIGGWERWRIKVESFSHAEYRNDLIYRSEEAFARHVRETTSDVGLRELPAYVQANIGKFPVLDG